MMFALKKHITRMERGINEKFHIMIYHHSILGLITIFVGIPAATFALVCGCTLLFSRLYRYFAVYSKPVLMPS